MEDIFSIRGGSPLKGTVEISGAKNVALKVMIAAMLLDGKTRFDHVPHIEDVQELQKLLDAVGVKTSLTKDSRLTVDATGMNSTHVDLLYASKMRVSFMLFAPFLHKKGTAHIPNPGGCRLGARPIDRMIDMMDAFGVKSVYNHDTGYYDCKSPKGGIRGATYRFPKATHTGTELAIMFGVLARGDTIIQNASLEPEIDDLISFLNLSGANIIREGTEIHIHGVKRLQQDEPYRIMNDRNEAVTYACAAIATKGDITVLGAVMKDLIYFIVPMQAIGAGIEEVDGGIRFYYDGPIKACDVVTQPEPGFMTDWQSPWAIMMTQASGISRIHETIFEQRFGYVKELRKLGAKISFYNPHAENPNALYQFNITSIENFKESRQAIKVKGPSMLHGGVLQITDLRAGATLVIAACMAKGESVLYGVRHIDRGYEELEVKLTALGADIKRITL